MPRSDFNGDGRDDIVLRNSSTGAVMNWLGQPDGSFVYNETSGIDPWASGTLVGIGDFNSDGRSDTLWRDSNGGLNLSYTYPDGAFYFHWSLGFVAPVPTSWSVAGIGDFNGDGRDDILWRNDDGQLTDWLGQANGSFANNPNASVWVPTSWHIAATGDFNGDGRDDILWRNDSGDLTNWLGQTDGSFANNANASTWVPTAWEVQPDILL